MNLSSDAYPLSAGDFLLLLKHILSGSQEDVDLEALRAASPVFTEEQAWTRARLLGKQIGIPEGHEPYVGEGFARALANAGGTGRLSKVMVEVIRMSCPNLADATEARMMTEVNRLSCSRFNQNSGMLDRYQDKVLHMLRRSQTGVIHEAAGDFVRTDQGTMYQPWLNTLPLTRQWPQLILESPAWNRIESPVPGIPDLPMDDSWVNLTLRKLDANLMPHVLDTQAWQELGFNRRGMGDSVEEVLLKTQRLTVITGLPGAGKSTLIKWIARWVVTSPQCPFGIPIVISLRHYARDRAQRPGLSLLEYFLDLRGITDSEQLTRWRMLAAGLLDPAPDQPETVETFLWLLDGWDEVPLEMRDSLMPEIENLALYPVILTTRLSGDSGRLPASQRYEVQGLQHRAALELASRWLKHTGRELYYAAIEEALEHHPDLRRMARNPFLLTLLCALASSPEGGVPRALPKNRGDVLRETLKLVYEHHNHVTKHQEKFGRRDQRHLSRFGWWLLAEAPDAPRYVFDEQDYDGCTGEQGRFASLLVPSRLIAKPTEDKSDYQFLHASFQEYLAAEHFADAPAALPDEGGLILNQQWKEVARFLAGMVKRDTPEWNALWQEARKVAGQLDRFGILAARLTSLLAAVQAEDGGQELLGRDLREDLWEVMARHASLVPILHIEAFLELDATGFARRILDHRIKKGQNATLTAWLEQVPITSLEPLFDELKYREVLARPEVASLCQDLPEWIEDEHGSPPAEDEWAYYTAVYEAAKRGDLLETKRIFWQLVDEGCVEVAMECLQWFGEFDPPEAGAALLEIVTSPAVDDMTRGDAVSQLISSGDAASCDGLMEFLATREMDDPCAFAIIANLGGHLLNELEARLVMDFLHECPDADTRSYAAELLAHTRCRDASASLITAFFKESMPEVRRTILRMLTEIADEASLSYCWNVPLSELKTAEEHGLWLRLVLTSFQHWRGKISAYGRGNASHPLLTEIPRRVKAFLKQGLSATSNENERALAEAVFEFPEILGSEGLSLLLEAAGNSQLNEASRLEAVRGLARLNDIQAVPFLLNLARASEAKEMKQVACEALGTLSPVDLAKIKSTEATQAMARLAFRHQMLFMKEGVLDANGRHLNKKTMKQPKEQMPMPFKADVAVFIAMKEEFDHFYAMVKNRCKVSWSHCDDPQKAITYYGVKLPGSEGGAGISLAVMCAEEMGPQRAANLGSALVERFEPAALVVIGIAGSLSPWIRLGDVLVPNEVFAWAENSAAVDGANGWELKASAKHIPSNAHLLNQVRQIDKKQPELYKKWKRRAKQRVQKKLGKDLYEKAVEKKITSPNPELAAGDNFLATGPTVGMSANFAKWLKDQNRTANAMDMETAAAYDAAWTTIHPARMLAIRGISDFADHRKSEVEQDYKGKFRDVCMLNATDFFLLLVEAGVFGEVAK